MSDCICNDGETLGDILDEIKKNPPKCILCGMPYDGDLAFSFSESVHLACKEKAGYRRWEAITQKKEKTI